MLRLITIPISHYCDKARWGLERAGLTYREDAHLQLFHYAATLRAGGGITAPVLVHDQGVIDDSSDILHWIDARCPEVGLYPDGLGDEVRALEARYDAELGPSGRLFMYNKLLPHPELVDQFGCTGVPGWQRAALKVVFPFAKRTIELRLGVSAEAALEARGMFLGVFDEVKRRLADGRPFLTGDNLTAADITFAALSAPLVLPREYGVPLPQPAELPKAMALEVEACREHPAGKFALRLYRRHRNECLAPAA